MVTKGAFLIFLLGACVAVASAQFKCLSTFCLPPTICQEVPTDCGKPHCPTTVTCVPPKRSVPLSDVGCLATLCAYPTVCRDLPTDCGRPDCPTRATCVPRP